MRIQENCHDGGEFYTDDVKKMVEQVFDQAQQLTELRTLLAQIKEKAEQLNGFIMTPEDEQERKELLDFFDMRMQSMAFCTMNNMEKYHLSSWQELVWDGEQDDDGAE